MTVDPLLLGEGQTFAGPLANLDDGSDGTPTSKYVTRLTQELFGRNAGPRDVALAVRVTDNRLPREQAAFEWITSTAFQKVRAEQILQYHFPGFDISAAINDTVQRLAGGMTEEEIRAFWIGSTFYAGRFNNNAASILNGFYQELLGRSPSNAEKSFYATWNVGPNPRASYTLALMQGDEYRQGVTRTAFVAMLGRQPSDNELVLWSKLLAGGGLRTPQLSASLAGMPEFTSTAPGNSEWLAKFAARLMVTNPPPLDLFGRRFETVAGRGQRAFDILTGQEFADIRINTEFAGQSAIPSAADLKTWLAQINSWPGLEYLTPYLIGQSTSFDYVQTTFQTIMGRLPTLAESNLGRDFINGGGSRSNYAAYLIQSSEYRTNWAFNLLQNDLCCEATTNQLASLTAQLNLGVSPVRARSTVLGSPEYAALTNSIATNLVDKLYQSLLGRNPTNGNETIRLASQPASRLVAVQSVMITEAYATNTLSSYTHTYLNRNPTTAELNEIPPLSLQPGYIEAIRVRLLGSDEFYSKSGGQPTAYIAAVLSFLIPGASASDYLPLYNASPSRPAFITSLLATAEYRLSAAGKLISQWLKREAGPQEKARLAGRSAAGWDAQDLVAATMAGDEYYELNGGTPDRFQQAALASLGLTTNTNIEWPILPLTLELGDAPRLASERFVSSLTFRTNLMESASISWLGRKSTTNELKAIGLGWTNGATVEQQWSELLGSSNFFVKVGSQNSAYVSAVIQNVLGRAANAADNALFNATINTNGTRADFAQKVFLTIEYGQKLATTLYPLFLKRSPQGAETTNMVQLRLSGVSLESAWAAVATLPDAQSLSMDSLGLTIWNGLTGTPLSSDAAAAWAESWRGAAARANLASLWSAFPSVVTNRVAGYFQTILARAPVKADLDNSLLRLGRGETMVNLRALLFASTEYFNKSGGNNTGWINAIYQNLFSRLPDANERTFWVQQLNGGLPRQKAATSLLGSFEGRQQSVRDAGLRIMDRPLTDAEVALESSFDRDGSSIIHLLASDERFANSQAVYVSTIEWGNGLTNAGTINITNGIQQIVGTNTYASSGLYPLKVRVASGTVTLTATNLVTVTNVPPTVAFTPNTLKYNGVVFSIDGTFTDPGDDTWTGEVSYGDGTPVEALPLSTNKTFSLSHVYLNDGNYQVSVTVRDTHGGSGSAQVLVPANPNQPKIVRFLSDSFSADASSWLLVSTNGVTSEQPVYQTLGGNPDGYLSSRNSALGEGFVWRAPSRYQGNKIELLGGVIAFDVRKAEASAITVGLGVRLTGNDFAIVHEAVLPAGTNWIRLQFPVTVGSGWTNTSSGKAVTLTELQSVLNSVIRVDVAADFSTNSVGGDFDNFVFAGTDPGPAPRLLIAPRTNGQVLLVWPTINDTYVVQRAFAITGPWETLSGTITVGVDGYRFFHQPTGPTEFYRLIK